MDLIDWFTRQCTIPHTDTWVQALFSYRLALVGLQSERHVNGSSNNRTPSFAGWWGWLKRQRMRCSAVLNLRCTYAQFRNSIPWGETDWCSSQSKENSSKSYVRSYSHWVLTTQNKYVVIPSQWIIHFEEILLLANCGHNDTNVGCEQRPDMSWVNMCDLSNPR